MSASHPALENYFVHKMDAKNRLSVPSEFRLVEEGTPIRMMKSKEHGLPVIKVFTEEHYQDKFRQLEEASHLSQQQKNEVAGALRMFSKQVTISAQGKLTVPKEWADRIGVRAEDQVVLGGRGDHFILCSEDTLSRIEAALDGLSDGGMGLL